MFHLKDERITMINKTMEQIEPLWHILQVPLEEQESFKTTYQKDLSSETIAHVIILLME